MPTDKRHLDGLAPLDDTIGPPPSKKRPQEKTTMSNEWMLGMPEKIGRAPTPSQVMTVLHGKKSFSVSPNSPTLLQQVRGMCKDPQYPICYGFYSKGGYVFFLDSKKAALLCNG